MSATFTPTEHVIIGTAGHIDHGKTALVKALTGIDADTLPEEKRRGITIELGFVFMETSGFEREIVFIDVPGHERLVRTMVAGASNIDGALLVVAADEGIGAQTLEHFEILQLLGIEKGLVALTKTDLVDSGRMRAVQDEVEKLVAGTFLSDAPVIPVSSLTGAGVEEVKSALLTIAKQVRRRGDSGIFRMPIDRVFTMAGFGTVIAGTILSGQVTVGDRIEIFPEGITGRVRGIQVHGEGSEESCAGRRTAINLPDISKDRLRRGQCAGAAGSLRATNRLDAWLHLLSSQEKELKNRARLRLHLGTEETISRVVLLDRDSLAPGGTALVQFVLEAPSVALPRDRFVVRMFSPPKTIGGGVILDAGPTAHKRFNAETLQRLEKLGGETGDLVEQMFVKSGFVAQSPAEVALCIGESNEEVTKVVERLRSGGRLVRIGGEGSGRSAGDPLAERYVHSCHYDDLLGRVVDALRGYLERHPYQLLMPTADLQSQFLKLADKRVFETIVADLERKGTIYREDTRIGIVGHEIRLTGAELEVAGRIEEVFREAGFATPLEEEVRQEMGIAPQTFENIMVALIEQGRLVRLSQKVTYHREHAERAQRIVTEHIRNRGSIAVGELRDELGVSRKYALGVLEHFDKIGLTRREGDAHVRRGGGKV